MEWYPCENCGQAHPFKVTASKPCPNKSSRGGGESRGTAAQHGVDTAGVRVPKAKADVSGLRSKAGVTSSPREAKQVSGDGQEERHLLGGHMATSSGVTGGARKGSGETRPPLNSQSSDAARAAPRKPKRPPPGASPAASGAIKPKVGRPLASQAHLTIAHQKPWIGLGMSRTTWFRRQAEKAKK